jgi:drug/metabolite transporter (DMT)-like permease
LAATFGQICLTKAFRTGKPSRVSVVNLSQVLLGLAVDVFYFQKTFEPRQIVGVIMTMAASAMVILIRDRRPTAAKKLDPGSIESPVDE